MLAAGAIVAFASGCGVSFSTSDTIDQSDEVKNAQNFIDQQLTSLPPTKSVDCPDGVDAKTGTAFECTATLENGQKITIPLVVKSTSDSGGTVSSNPDIVDQALAVDLIYEAANSPVKTVDCPTSLKAKPGATFQCKATLQDGEVDNVTIKILSVSASGSQHMTIANVEKA